MKIIIITGTPGSGKTTITKDISRKKGIKSVHLNKYIISKGLAKEFDEDRKTYIVDTDEISPYIKNFIQEMAKKGTKNLIIESHLADIVPNDLIDLVIILRCHPDVLKKRLESRGYSKRKVKENLQAEILGNATNFIHEKNLDCPVYEIDTSEISQDKLVQIIMDLIDRKKQFDKYDIGKIDWLEMLSKKNRILEFF